MKRSKVFQRGQVWYWEDPLYGRKSDGNYFPPGEVIMRGNRYVLIIQADDTIGDSSIICVPCSSSNHDPNDVQIPVASLWHDGYSYAKCKSIFTAHPKYLKRFMCTLPDEVMTLIDAQIVKLCLPCIKAKLSDEEIKEFLGIDLTVIPEVEYTRDEREYENAVLKFMQKDLIYTGNHADKVKVLDLKLAFDLYCSNNDIAIVGDMVKFMDSVVRNINPNIIKIYGWKNLDASPWNITELVGVKIPPYRMVITQEKVKTGIKLGAPADTPNPEKPKKNVWDQETMKKFCDMYREKGVEKTAKEFKIGHNTAIRYNSKFMSALGISGVSQQAVTPSARVTLPTARDIGRSVSKVSNMIRDHMLKAKVHKMLHYTDMESDEFYAKLQSSIYYSLLEFMNVRVNGSKMYIPTLTENSANLDTWRFFDYAYHDQSVSRSKNLTELSTNMKQFHSGILISSEWLPNLSKRLVKRGVAKNDIDVIFGFFREMIVG